jgi:probable O-glycosylation ligase (exosortase A-associated)
MRDLALVSVVALLLALSVARPFVGILVWSWISFMNPHQDAYGFVKTMPLAMLAFVATMVGCLIAREPRRPAVNTVTVLLAALAFWVTLTSFTALAPPAAVWGKWDRTVKIIAGLLLTASMLDSRHRISALVWLMAISLGYYGLKGGIFTVMTGGAFQVLGPNNSLIADRNHIAVGLLVALPLMNWLRLQARHTLVRHVLLAVMGGTLLAAIGTQSRGALVSLVAVAGVLWLRSNGKVVSGIVIVLAMAGAIAFMPESWVERMRTIQDYEGDASAMGRIWIWWVGWQIALSRPILGGGFRAVYQQDIVNRFDPSIPARADHSIWFETLSEQGFIGFAIWLGILVAGTLYSFAITRQARDRPDLRWAYDLARMCQVSITAFVTGGSFLSLAYWDYFWTILVVLGATRALVAAAAPHAAPAQAAPSARSWQAEGSAAPARRAATARP